MIYVADCVLILVLITRSFVYELIPDIVIFLLVCRVILHPFLFDFEPHLNHISGASGEARIILLDEMTLTGLVALP